MTTFKARSMYPYSLHDAKICGIQMREHDLVMTFVPDCDWTELPSRKEVMGKCVTVQGLDLDFCGAYLLSVNGREGVFRAEKMSVDRLCGMVSEACVFEIVDELYSWNQVLYSGYLYTGKNFREMQISLYHTGNIVYETV